MSEDSTRPSISSAVPQQVTILRIALFMGVVVFGVVGWSIRNQEPVPPGTEDIKPLVYVFIALAAGAISIAAIMKRRQEATEEWGRRVTFGIAGWAACESTALVGGVYYLLTGTA